MSSAAVRPSLRPLDPAELQLHDAELIAIDVSRDEHRLSLSFWLDDSKHRTLTFVGVVAFRLTDFVMQNVVSRLRVSSVAAFSDDEIRHWIRWADSFSDATSVLADDAIGRCLDQIRRGEYLLCVLESSRGAERADICEAVFAESV